MFFLLLAVSAYGADATGFYTPLGCAPIDASYRLVLHFRLDNTRRSFSLKIPEVWFLAGEGGWFEVYGEECDAAGHCEIIKKCRINVLHLSNRSGSLGGMSGNFELLSGEGEKRAGSFSASFKKPAHQFICE